MKRVCDEIHGILIGCEPVPGWMHGHLCPSAGFTNPCILKEMTSAPSPLRLYPTEATAKKAGLALADLRGERLSTVLYALLPEAEKKPTYLLSSSLRLTVPERRWVEEHSATVTKLGNFHPGRNFAPLQMNMVRKQKPAEQG